jgi:uridine monophosphate synthetase
MLWQKEKEDLGQEIICSLYDEGMIKTWFRDNPQGWILVSGIWSPFYIQLRPLSSYPKLLKSVGYAMGKMIREEIGDVDKVIGVAMAGIPIATAVTICEGIPSCFTRKLEGVKNLRDFKERIKEYGEHALIEGELESGDRLVLIDDLVTKFDSKLISIEQIKEEVKRRNLSNLKCQDITVLFDREQGAQQRAKECGMNLYSLIPFKSKGLNWLEKRMAPKEQEVIMDYIKNTEKYQDKEIQKQVISISRSFK